MVLRLTERMKIHSKCNVHIVTKTKNAVKCSHGNAESPYHRRMKWVIADWCYENGIEFATGVVFKNNKRADVLILDWGLIIEVLHSETLDQFKNKNYPLPSIPIKSNDEISWVLGVLKDLNITNGKEWAYYKEGINRG